MTQKGSKFQLCVKHRLLPKPFYHSFDTEVEADNYGKQLRALLSRGFVPGELLEEARKPKVVSPLLIEIMRAYEKDPNTRVAATELPTLALLAKEAPGMRMDGLTFIWANQLIAGYKKRKLSPGTIRKRIGALARVEAWYHRTTAVQGQVPKVNVLSLLPRGYSQYVDGSVRDVHRDRSMSPSEDAAIRRALAGVKRDDRVRPWGVDPAFELLYEMLVDTGLRLREVYTLSVTQLDTERGVLRVNGTKGHHGVAKPRTVPLKRGLRAKLIAWREGRAGLIFPFWDGTPEDLKSCTARLSARFATLFAYAGVENFTEHDLRHEACCRWVMLKGEQGWLFNEIEICKIMGWSDTKMMLRCASLCGEDLADRLI